LTVGLLLAGCSWGVGVLTASKDVEAVRAVTILSVLSMLSLVLFWWVSRPEAAGRTLWILLFISLGLKLGAMYFRFYIDLLADALVYNDSGRSIALQLTRGQWPEVITLGTRTVHLIVGLVYVVTGPTLSGISILWTWLGFLGMLFFYKVFVLVFPGGNLRLYRALILFYPSVLLWTSSLGKDALMFLFLGMAAYGAARTQQRLEPLGLCWLGVGLAGMVAVRPPIAAVFAVALASSSLIRPIRVGALTPIVRVIGLMLFVAISVAVVRAAAVAARLETVETQSVQEFIETRRAHTQQGGAAFQPVNPGQPAGMLMFLPTVLIRPFPWEAHNASALLTAFEGMGLLALIIYRRRSVWAGIRGALRHSYLLLVVVYTLLFSFFFTAIANFGILARQRVQLLPFVFMLIAYLPTAPVVVRRVRQGSNHWREPFPSR